MWQPLPKGEMLIEYQGDLIRSSLSDRFLEKYTRMGIPGDCYIFRVDESIHVDATMAGNIARFMNHSCQVVHAITAWTLRVMNHSCLSW